MEQLLKNAVLEYLNRRAGIKHPDAQFVQSDNGTGWWLVTGERLQCCERIPEGMRFMHCHGLEHVASLFGVGPVELKKAVKSYLKESKNG